MSLITIGDETYGIAVEMVKLANDKSLPVDFRICRLPQGSSGWTMSDSQVDEIHQQIQRHFEATAMIPLIMLLYSQTDGLTVTVLELLRGYSNHVQIISYYITLMPKGSGLDTLNQVLTHQYALSYSNYFGIRYLRESLSFLESRDMKDIQFFQIYRLIASDFVLLYTTLHHTCHGDPIQLPTSASNKCCDFRSSFWRQSSSPQKTRVASIEEGNKFRDVAVNLHSLHLHHRLDSVNAVVTSELISFAMREGKLIRSKMFSEDLLAEGKVSFDWATPGLKYSIFDSNYSYPRYLSHSSRPEIPMKSIFEMGLLFQSPYTVRDLRQSVAGVRTLVSSGAYLHLYGRYDISVEDVLDAAETVDFYTGGM